MTDEQFARHILNRMQLPTVLPNFPNNNPSFPSPTFVFDNMIKPYLRFIFEDLRWSRASKGSMSSRQNQKVSQWIHGIIRKLAPILAQREGFHVEFVMHTIPVKRVPDVVYLVLQVIL